jgi:hypothetical protein|tara:strand:+ start:694 stop:1131 length:438 start_codon:yes stop_codon:yes gene_type:complete
MKVLMAKSLNSLHPTDDQGRDLLRTMAQGEEVWADITRPRNPQFHKKLMAMLRIILHNQDYYKTIDELLDVAKLNIGHYETTYSKQFGIIYRAKSISFAALDEAGFQAIYDRIVVWVCTEVIPGLERQGLDEAVREALLGFGESP